MSTKLRIAVAGASGRMGRMLIEAVRGSGDMVLAGALDIAASPALGQDASAFLGAASGVAITADLRTGLADAQVLIDFTRPEGTLAHLAVCRELGVRLVVDGKLSSLAMDRTFATTSGTVYYYKCHFGSANTRHLKFQIDGANRFDGVVLGLKRSAAGRFASAE